MEGLPSGLLRYAAVVTAVAAFAFAAGCGGDDGDDKAETTAPPSGAEAIATAQAKIDAATTSEDQIRATYQKFVEGMYAVDADAVCSVTGPQVDKELAPAGCVKGFTTFWKSLPGGGVPKANRPFIVSLKVNGDKAVATVKTKTSNKYRIPLIKQDGAWKLNGGIAPTTFG